MANLVNLLGRHSSLILGFCSVSVVSVVLLSNYMNGFGLFHALRLIGCILGPVFILVGICIFLSGDVKNKEGGFFND